MNIPILGHFIERFFVLIVALIFIQYPLFIQHYEHHLIGHVEELKHQVKEIKKAASSSGKTLEEWIYKFSSNKDVDFSKQGHLMNKMVTRLETLNQGLISLKNSTILTRPFYFIFFIDLQIAKDSLTSFQVGLTLSYESLIYAFIGIITASFILALFRKIQLKSLVRQK